MLAYQNPTFQTEIETPIDTIKKAISTVFLAKKPKYVNTLNNELLNTFSCETMYYLSLVRLSIQLQKIDENKTIFKIESQSPLGGCTKQALQLVMDTFIAEMTDAVTGKLKVIQKPIQESDPKEIKKELIGRIVIIYSIAAILLALVIWLYFFKK